MLPYRSFLAKAQEELQEAIQGAENAGWHHGLPESSAMFHYLRLTTWEAEVTERLNVYDTAKASKTIRSGGGS